MEEVTLFELKNDNIHIKIGAYFFEDCLVIDGYDIGKTVKEFWGDSDYEYEVKIPPTGVIFLYRHFSIKHGNRMELLHALKKKYHTNLCYSEIRHLLDRHAVHYESFTWT